MSMLTVPIGDDELPRLEAVARAHHTRPEKLIASYVRYLALGGMPVIFDGEVTSEDLARIAMAGGSFEWLADEPDLYSESDGVPYTARLRRSLPGGVTLPSCCFRSPT